MNVELFNPKLNTDNSLSARALSRIRLVLGRSKYVEVYGELIYPYEGGTVSDPAKAVLRDGQAVAVERTSTHWRPRKFVDPLYVPDFARDRCVNLSDGDYKIILADEDGRSKTVIKRYSYHTYWGAYAQERAQVAATKLDQMYEVMRDICPQHILPTERFIHGMPYILNGEEGWAVFERQQRALFSSPWLFEDPKTAERMKKDAKRLSNKYHKKIVRELWRRGISERDSYKGIALAELNFGLRYDALTRTLVADDIIDYVTITDPRFAS